MKKMYVMLSMLMVCASVFAQGNGMIRGYYCRVDIGGCFNANGVNESRVEVSTTHGYQFNPYFFIGGGVQVDLLTKVPWHYKDYALPVYLDLKWNILDKIWTPIIEGRFGYSIAGNTGHYFATSIGVQHAFKGGKTISFSWGGEYQVFKDADGEYNLENGPFIKLGFDL